MVRRAKQFSRRAFTIIELIFAIVIISISVVSLPMMIQVNNKSMENSMVQEAIFAASVELMNASAGYWDANSMVDQNVNHLSRVIDIGATCEKDTASPRYRLRPGHIAQPFHRRCVEIATVVVKNTSDVNFPNLDNAAHSTKDMFTDNETREKGYKKNYKSQVTVNQDGTNANIKHIEIDVKDGEDVVVKLRMQSANIGEIDYYKRTL